MRHCWRSQSDCIKLYACAPSSQYLCSRLLLSGVWWRDRLLGVSAGQRRRRVDRRTQLRRLHLPAFDGNAQPPGLREAFAGNVRGRDSAQQPRPKRVSLSDGALMFRGSQRHLFCFDPCAKSVISWSVKGLCPAVHPRISYTHSEHHLSPCS